MTADRTLVGRSEELASIARAHEAGRRALALVGPPGVGKTALAEAIARQRADGRAVVARLSDVQSQEELCARLARDIGVPRSAAETPDEVARDLSRALGSSGVELLVLDAVDQLGSGTASMARELLALAPRLSLITTSRRAPDGLDAVVLTIAPLAVEPSAPGGLAPAVELLLRPAGGARAVSNLDDAELGVLTEIAVELDGLPLALELAAARLPLLGPAPILDALRRGPSATLPPLHRLIADAIASLDAVPRAALLQTSVFRGGFSFEAAEVVIDLSAISEDANVAEAVQTLVSASMLTSRTVAPPMLEARFDCLSTIRDAAFELLRAESGAEGAIARHADYYLTGAEEWVRSARGQGGRDRLALELENMVAVAERALTGSTRADAERALAAVLALEPILSSRGPLTLFVSLLDRALTSAATTDVEPVRRARAIRARWDAVRALARARDVLTGVTEATRAAADAEEPTLAARIGESVGEHHAERGRTSEGLVHLEAAARGFADAGDTEGEARAARAVARVALIAGDVARAETALASALAAARRAGSAREERSSRVMLAQARIERGDVEGATAELREAERVAVDENDVRLQIELDSVRGLAALASGASEEAIASFTELRTLAGGVDERMGASLERWLAISHAEAASTELAIEGLDRARLLARDAGLRWLEVRALSDQASYLSASGEGDVASRRLVEARAVLSGSDLPLDERLVMLREIEIGARHGDAGARQRATRAVESAPAHDTFDERRARRALRSALESPDAVSLEAVRAHQPAIDPDTALVVGPETRWFRARGEPRVEIATRGPLRRILAALIAARKRGEPLVRGEALLASGWPGERILPDSAQNRLYVAIATLRRLGLRDVLVRFDEGYRLDPDVPLLEEIE